MSSAERRHYCSVAGLYMAPEHSKQHYRTSVDEFANVRIGLEAKEPTLKYGRRRTGSKKINVSFEELETY